MGMDFLSNYTTKTCQSIIIHYMVMWRIHIMFNDMCNIRDKRIWIPTPIPDLDRCVWYTDSTIDRLQHRSNPPATARSVAHQHPYLVTTYSSFITCVYGHSFHQHTHDDAHEHPTVPYDLAIDVGVPYVISASSYFIVCSLCCWVTYMVRSLICSMFVCDTAT